jgi:kynurenine formamidase
MYKRLSYSITKEAPGWPGNPTFDYEPHSAIAKGDVTNEFKLKLFNHFGSHMDGPKHFNDEGPRLAEMPLETFIYDEPALIDIPKTFAELVEVDELKCYEKEIEAADLIMIRSGFSEERARQPKRYAAEGPGISAAACEYLSAGFPRLKAVAMDWISLASYAHMDEGVLAHRHLLGNFGRRFICIIEDLNFEGLDPAKIMKVAAFPMFVDAIDSAPVTVVANLED